MDKWYFKVGMTGIEILKNDVTAFKYMKAWRQDALREAYEDTEELLDTGQWTSNSGCSEFLPGVCYRLRKDWTPPAPDWWDEITETEVAELKRNCKAFGLCAPWMKQAFAALLVTGDAIYFAGYEIWKSETDLTEDPEDNLTYRLRANWCQPEEVNE